MATSVWFDNWVESGCSLQQLVSEIPQVLRSLKVCELVDGAGKWDLSQISHLIPVDIANRTIVILPPAQDRGEDRCMSCGPGGGTFSAFSAYALLDVVHEGSLEAIWMKVGKLKVPERVHNFI